MKINKKSTYEPEIFLHILVTCVKKSNKIELRTLKQEYSHPDHKNRLFSLE